MLLSRERAGFIAMIALCLGLLGAAQPADANAFCRTKVVRDYTGFLSGLPPLSSPPINERLPFAPERVYFRSLGSGPLQAGFGIRGFRLSYLPYEHEDTNPSPELNWDVTATLTSIDQFGQPLASPQTIEQHVDRLWPAGPGGAGEVRWPFHIPGEPAIYRLEIVFENGSGEQLAALGEYFRVLRPSVDLRVSLNRRKFRGGQTLRATLANYGVSWYGYGLSWGVEYRRGNSWTRPPVDFELGPFLAIRLGLKPGESTSCWTAEIPQKAVPGRYRFVTSIFEWEVNPPRLTQRPIRAGFTILPREDPVANTAVGRRTRHRAS